LPINQIGMLWVFGIQCLPSVKVSSCVGAFAFHLITSTICSY
jgi:hypothetical protein